MSALVCDACGAWDATPCWWVPLPAHARTTLVAFYVDAQGRRVEHVYAGVCGPLRAPTEAESLVRWLENGGTW